MPLFRSQRGIGRGETPESQLEAPIFAAALLLFGLVLWAQHLIFHNSNVTVALAVSGLVFGVTVTRADFGVYILIIAMLLSPEIELQDVESGHRSFTIRYDDMLILVIFMGVMVKLAYEGRFTLWQPSPVNLPIAAYYAVCLVSTLLAMERSLGAWDRNLAFFTLLKMLQFYMVFWLVGHATTSLRQVRQQLALFFVVALIVALYGVYSIGTTPRVSAPFESGGTEPNTLGGYLVICICVALGLHTQARETRWRLLFLGMALVCAFPLLYTLSRASYLALIVGTTVVGVVGRSYLLLGAVVLVLAASPYVMPPEVIERVAYTFQEEHGYDVGGGVMVDKSTGERFMIWRKVGFILTLAPVYALFGGGVAWERVLDSQYARVILETGLVGLAAFVFLQFSVLRTLRQSYRWTEDWVGRGLAMGMFAVTLALIVHSTGTISFLIVRIMMPFWVLTAMCVHIRNHAIATHYARHRARVQAARAAAEAAAAPPGRAASPT
jgi:hypothetical protein